MTSPETRGRAFGFQRAMDHTGAVIGPLVASALLASGIAPRPVFLLSALPAALCIAVLAGWVREEKRSREPADGRSFDPDRRRLSPLSRRPRPLHAGQLVRCLPPAARPGAGRVASPWPRARSRPGAACALTAAVGLFALVPEPRRAE